MSYEFTAPPKDPQSVLRHGMDWSGWLDAGETIAARTVTADSPAIVIDQVTDAAGVVSWRVSGGTLGSNHIVTVRVTTSTGRIDDRSVRYLIAER